MDDAKKRFCMDVGGTIIVCTYCKHKRKGLTCDAFPDRIPDALIDKNNHSEPFEGDNGIMFEPKE